MPWSNQSGGPWGSGSRGPWGSGPQQPGGGSRPPDFEEFLRSSQDRLRSLAAGQSWRPRHRAGRAGPRGAVGFLRLLPRRARRTRRGAALRQIRPRGAAGAELPPALSDRDRADAAGAARQQDRRRHPRGRGAAQHLGARVAGRKPDADRRREHRRRRFLGAVAGQPEQSRRLSFQRPESRRHRQGGGRERHAGGDRALERPAAAHRGGGSNRWMRGMRNRYRT